jgi:hypothetical protein
MKKIKIYISGAITNDQEYKAKFAEVEKRLQKNYIVLNPAILPEGMKYTDYMKICMPMVEIADSIFILKDWEKNKGAKAEVAYAKALNKVTIYE